MTSDQVETKRTVTTFFVMSCDTTRVVEGALTCRRQGLYTYSWGDHEKSFTVDPFGGDKFDTAEAAREAANAWFFSNTRPKYEAGDKETLQIVKVVDIVERHTEIVAAKPD